MPRVSYKGLVVDVLDQHLDDMIKKIRADSRSKRRHLAASVKRELEKAVLRLQAGQTNFSQQERENIADDVGLWFALEVIAGRHEQYGVKLQ